MTEYKEGQVVEAFVLTPHGFKWMRCAYAGQTRSGLIRVRFRDTRTKAIPAAYVRSVQS